MMLVVSEYEEWMVSGVFLGVNKRNAYIYTFWWNLFFTRQIMVIIYQAQQDWRVIDWKLEWSLQIVGQLLFFECFSSSELQQCPLGFIQVYCGKFSLITICNILLCCCTKYSQYLTDRNMIQGSHFWWYFNYRQLMVILYQAQQDWMFLMDFWLHCVYSIWLNGFPFQEELWCFKFLNLLHSWKNASHLGKWINIVVLVMLPICLKAYQFVFDSIPICIDVMATCSFRHAIWNLYWCVNVRHVYAFHWVNISHQ